ncbi:MAG TPA: XrtA/PEP-CTERM system histidine kinase PrsK [Rhodocyclaceae bacterium]|nr:XrtA/PEP-CTERM system histidine kinase PrsK [Rhodocyclaceae bacterium]
METGAAALASWGYGIAAFGYLLLFIFLQRRPFGQQPGRAGRALLCALIFSAIWSGLGLLLSLWEHGPTLRAYLLADVLRYGAWFLCLALMLYAPAAKAGNGARSLFSRPLAVGGCVLLCFYLLSALGLNVATSSTLHSVALSGLAMAVYMLVLIEQLLSNADPDARWSFKPLWLGLGVMFVLDLHLYSNALLFGRMDGDVLAIRGFVAAMIVPPVALSIARNKHKAIRLALSQTAVFHSTTLLLVGAYLMFVAAAGYYVRYFGGEWGGALQLIVFFSALLLLVFVAFSGAMRARLRVWVSKHFFRYRYDYRQEWLKFTKALTVEGQAQEVGQHVIRGLADMVESPAGALWLRHAGGESYVQAARWNSPEIREETPADTSLVKFLDESGWVVNMEEFRHMPGRYSGVVLPAWLAAAPNAWLIVPLSTGRELIGFVLLHTARTSLDVDWEVNDLLKTAGRQAAGFIAQMQATEALLEARKFDAFNRMSAFVVHDLKNIITQLSLMVKNAERHRDNPEFQQDMLLTVEHSVERMRQLMLQLRAGATPVAGTFGVNLAAIIRRIQQDKAGQEPSPQLSLQDGIMARGHEERIERVIGHVIQNALDATPAAGRIEVLLDVHEGMARVEVRDSGQGMSPEFLRDRLFKPFQTTKEAGMGIGAYESFQYVQELGGRIDVDSVLNVGTCVTMAFPLFEVRNESDVQRLEMA